MRDKVSLLVIFDVVTMATGTVSVGCHRRVYAKMEAAAHTPISKLITVIHPNKIFTACNENFCFLSTHPTRERNGQIAVVLGVLPAVEGSKT